MNRALPLLFALGLGTSLLAAQSANNGVPTSGMQSAVGIVIQDSSPQPCPVSLRVRQAANAFSREVDGAVPPGAGDRVIKNVAQKLHVSAAGPRAKRIVAANVTVRGYSNKSRFLPVLSTGNDFDAFRTFNVRFSEDATEGSTADFAVPGLTAVGAIDLNEVTYSDGSTWKIAGKRTCRTPIDGLMLVSGR